MEASETLITVEPIFGADAPAYIFVDILPKVVSVIFTVPEATWEVLLKTLSSFPILFRASSVALSTEKSLSI